MGFLHQLLAAKPVVAANETSKRTDLLKKLSSEAHFNSLSRSLEMFSDEDAKNENVTEDGVLVYSVEDIFNEYLKVFTDLANLNAQNEQSNANATAELEILGENLGTFHVTTLMSMEKSLNIIRDVAQKLPTLDPKIDWIPTPDTKNGAWRSATPKVTFKTKKQTEFPIVAPATDKHPAQVREVVREVNVGKYITYSYSTAIPVTVKDRLLENIDSAIKSVINAKVKANQALTDNITPFDKIVELIRR